MNSLSITDPSDFSNTTIPDLSDFDTNLRCQVCKEIFDTPMITSCSHTFCSKCIRQCLSADGKCPTCRAQDQSTKLRKNGIVQSLVQSWQTVRAAVLEAVQKQDIINTTRSRGKRKLYAEEVTDPRQPKRQTRSSSRKTVQTPSSSQVVILDSEDEGDMDCRSELPQLQLQPSPLQDTKGLVQCPICTKYMKEELVYSHLDSCTGAEPPPRQAPVQPPSPRKNDAPRQPLAYMNYTILKESDLRKKLQNLGIPSGGIKSMMQARHTHWVDIWNANCDSDKPRSKRDLLRELDSWERSHYNSNNSGVMKKDFDGGQWSKGHEAQFKDLIAQARARGQAKLNNAVDKPVEPTRPPGNIDEPGAPAMEMFKFAASQVTNDNDSTEDDSLYKAKTPPLQGSQSNLRVGGSSSTSALDASGKKLPMFQVPSEPVKDADIDMTMS